MLELEKKNMNKKEKEKIKLTRTSSVPFRNSTRGTTWAKKYIDGRGRPPLSLDVSRETGASLISWSKISFVFFRDSPIIVGEIIICN